MNFDSQHVRHLFESESGIPVVDSDIHRAMGWLEKIGFSHTLEIGITDHSGSRRKIEVPCKSIESARAVKKELEDATRLSLTKR